MKPRAKARISQIEPTPFVSDAGGDVLPGAGAPEVPAVPAGGAGAGLGAPAGGASGCAGAVGPVGAGDAKPGDVGAGDEDAGLAPLITWSASPVRESALAKPSPEGKTR